MIGSILLYGNSFSMFIMVAIILCVVGGIGGLIGGVIGSIMRESFETNKILGIIITVLLIAGILYFFGSSIFPPNKYKDDDIISIYPSWKQVDNSDTQIMIVHFVDSLNERYGLMPARINKNGDIIIRMSSLNGYPVYPDSTYLSFKEADKQYPYRLGVLNDFKQYMETFSGTTWILEERR
jgi:hypothetical protein